MRVGLGVVRACRIETLSGSWRPAFHYLQLLSAVAAAGEHARKEFIRARVGASTPGVQLFAGGLRGDAGARAPVDG